MTAAVEFFPTGILQGRATTIVPFAVTLSGTYAADGDALDLSIFAIKTAAEPVMVLLSGGLGFGVHFNAEDQKIQLFTSPGVELEDGAYPASIDEVENSISGIAIFKGRV